MNYSLKQELDSEIKANSRQRRRTIIILLILVSGVGILIPIGLSYRLKNQDSTTLSTSDNNELDNTSTHYNEVPNTEVSTAEPTEEVTPSTPTQTSSLYRQNLIKQSEQIDRSAFINKAHQIIKSYGDIVGIITSSQSTSDSTKADNIKTAIGLDRQYFGLTTDLRAQLNAASSTSGKYAELTKIIEDGVADISVGLLFMGYWSKDHSRITDYDIGIGNVTKGANRLLSASQELNAL